MTHHLKAIKECDPSSLEPISNEVSAPNGEKIDEILEENNKLFEKQVERNLVDTLIESVEKQKMKLPASKSLDSFRIIDQELHTFDCEGGSEEMFDEAKPEAADQTMDNYGSNSPLSSTVSVEAENENLLCDEYNKMSLNGDVPRNGTTEMSEHEKLKMCHAVNVVNFYLAEVEDESIVSMYELAAVAVNFWVASKFPIKELEKVFDKYMKKIFYSLGLLIYG